MKLCWSMPDQMPDAFMQRHSFRWHDLRTWESIEPKHGQILVQRHVTCVP